MVGIAWPGQAELTAVMTDSNDNYPSWTARPIGEPAPASPVGTVDGETALMPDDTALRPAQKVSDEPSLSSSPEPERTDVVETNETTAAALNSVRTEPVKRSSSGLVMLAVVACTMLLVLGLGVLLSSVLTDGTTEASGEAKSEESAVAASPTESDSEKTASTDASSSVSSLANGGSDSSDGEEFGTVADAYEQSAFARLDGLSLHLEGTVPSQDVGDMVEARAAELLGQPAVKANYTVDPAVPLPADPPLFASSTVLFESDGTVNAGSMGTLNLAFTLLLDFPEARVIVSAPPEDQLEVDEIAANETQATAVAQFWIEKGLDPARVRVEVQDGQVETTSKGASADAGVLEREIEFVVRGLLASDQP